MKQCNNELIAIKSSKLYSQLTDELKNVIDFIFTQKPVYEITGNEFPNNGENFSSLINRISEFYKNNFNSKIKVENFGEILLDKKSVKNSSYHQLSKNKVNAFAAVPYVLQKGKIADYIENYKRKDEDRFLFVAPITINNESYFCEVIVKATDRKNSSGVKRFYLHEIELTKKIADVFLTSCGGTSANSKSIIAYKITQLHPNVN